MLVVVVVVAITGQRSASGAVVWWNGGDIGGQAMLERQIQVVVVVEVKLRWNKVAQVAPALSLSDI